MSKQIILHTQRLEIELLSSTIYQLYRTFDVKDGTARFIKSTLIHSQSPLFYQIFFYHMFFLTLTLGVKVGKKLR